MYTLVYFNTTQKNFNQGLTSYLFLMTYLHKSLIYNKIEKQKLLKIIVRKNCQ